MTATLSSIISGNTINSSNETLYTSTGAKTQIINFSLCNYAVVARTVTIYMVPSGQSVGNDYLIVKDFLIDPDQSRRVAAIEGKVMESGAAIIAVASAASSVTANASGLVVTS